MANLDQQMRLPDGRSLGYDEYGPPDGKPLFYFHGGPSSRREWPVFGSEELAHRLNLRVIVPDRPGMGLSDFQVGRRLLDWPADVSALAEHLGLERFAVLGYSVGGPYAAACACKIPERLQSVGMVSSWAPFESEEITSQINPGTLRYLYLARDRPWLNRLSLRIMGWVARRSPNRFVAQARALLPEADQVVMDDPAAQRAFLAMVREALRQGPAGAQRDGLLMVSEWGFDPAEIWAFVHLWHGEADRNAPVAMGRYLASAIPNSRARFYPGEGHVSLFYHRIEEILVELRDWQA